MKEFILVLLRAIFMGICGYLGCLIGNHTSVWTEGYVSGIIVTWILAYYLYKWENNEKKEN